MNPAQMLGVLGYASHDKPTLPELKARWKELCRKHHPDTGGDEEIFRSVTHAYRFLTDASYRQSAIEDELRRGNRNIRGDLNLKIVVPLSFEDGFFGRMAHVSFNRQHLDQNLKPIPQKVQDVQNLLVHVPPGSTDGYQFTARGAGHLSGETAGDALIGFAVQPHARFRVDGMDVVAKERVPLDIMVKGGKLEVLTLYGMKTAKVPAGSKNGDSVQVKRCGVGARGAHRVELEAVFPGKDELRGAAWAGLKIDFSEAEEEDQEAEDLIRRAGGVFSELVWGAV